MKRYPFTVALPAIRPVLCLATMILLLTAGCRTGDRPGKRSGQGQPEQRRGRVRISENAWTYEEVQGKRIYSRYCVHCHGSEGTGEGFNAYALDPPPRDLSDPSFHETVSDSLLAEMIRFGGRRESVSLQMPAFVFTLTPEEVSFLTAAVRAFRTETDTPR
jgi:mono/diheme cytochrome c family protein